MRKLLILFLFWGMGTMVVRAQIDNCDVNGDGDVNISDVIHVVDHILGKHHPIAIDLGLPSGIKWASCNVGAKAPEEFGGYYAWGEIEEKECYNWTTYLHCDETWDTCYDLNFISGTEYDVAHVKWGGNWRMPTYKDMLELYNYCTYELITLNGVLLEKMTSTVNGNSIYFPAGGYIRDDTKQAVGVGAKYWIGDKYQGHITSAYEFYFSKSVHGQTFSPYGVVFEGGNVRPVLDNQVNNVKNNN